MDERTLRGRRDARPSARWLACPIALLLIGPAGSARADSVAPVAPVARASIAPETRIAKQTLGQGTTVDDLLRAGMRANLRADYASAEAMAEQLGKLDPGHPAGPFLESQTLYWKMLYDDEDRRYDEAIEATCVRVIELAEQRLDEGEDATGHFFAGQGYMNIGRLRGFRGHYYAAGKAGERARKHLERALELRPGWVDVEYQLGAYYFYASLIPDMVTKWLGWLWFIPMGNADLGIAYIKRVAEQGDLYKDDAQLILANIYTYYREEELASAVRLIRDLHGRYPDNPLIHFELVETLFAAGEYEEMTRQALALERKPAADEGRRGRQTVSLIWRARAELMLGRPERTLELLAPLEANPPTTPHWASAWADLTRGHALDVAERRDEALIEYREVLAYERPFGSSRAEEHASAAIEAPFALAPVHEISAAP
jgi:tetratricopeptide (TPR) repeat protein